MKVKTMTLPTLYCRRADGTIQEWTIHQRNDRYWSVYGIVGGKSIRGTPTTCTGKNIGKASETSPVQQAIMEAKALWDKKQKDGYAAEPGAVDSHTAFFPMLAQSYEDRKEDSLTFPCYIQPKLDGIRCVLRSDGMWSRSGRPLEGAPHIWEEWKKFFRDEPSVIIDGELYNHKLRADFNSIVSHVRKTKGSTDALARSKSVIQFHAYDIVDMDKQALTFTERTKWLRRVIGAGNFKHTKLVITNVCNSPDQIPVHMEKWTKLGYEGAMYRDPSAPYEQGKRSKFLLKLKGFIEEEFEIVAIHEGLGKRAGIAGSVELVVDKGTDKERTFKANIMGTEAFYKSLWDDRDKMPGKTATVIYQNRTPPPNSVPRCPRVKCLRDYE